MFNKKLISKRDIVILNAAFALFANGGLKDIPEAIEKVKAGLDSGNAVKHLKLMAEVSNSF